MSKPSSSRIRPGARSSAQAERKVGRSDPPEFIFEPLRTGILERVTGPAGLATKVLGIVAPVGYGKTVLMSLLMADLKRAGKQCLWVALDERDTSADAVISGLRGLLQARPSKLHPTQALFSVDETVDRRIDALVDALNRLSAADHPVRRQPALLQRAGTRSPARPPVLRDARIGAPGTQQHPRTAAEQHARGA